MPNRGVCSGSWCGVKPQLSFSYTRAWVLMTLIERVRKDEGDVSPEWTREEVAGGGVAYIQVLSSATEKKNLEKLSKNEGVGLWGVRNHDNGQMYPYKSPDNSSRDYGWSGRYL